MIRPARGIRRAMSDQPWGVDANNPLDEGSEPTAVPDANIAEQKAGDDPTAQDGTDVRTEDGPLAYDPGTPSGL